MEENLEHPEPEAAPAAAAPAPPHRLKTAATAAMHKLGGVLPRLGLYLFMLAAPCLIVAYPGYLLFERLAVYAHAQPVEVEFVTMEIDKVRDDDESGLFRSRGHIDVKLTFKAEDGKAYVAVLEKPWISPGLKGKMEDQFQPGDPNVLYRMPNGKFLLEEEVAKDNLLLLTLFMGLVFVGTLVFVGIRKRLSVQQPEIVHPAFTATAKSIIAAQGTALLISLLLSGLIFYQPVFIPDLLYLGAYWGIVIFLAISLRLLVFEPPHPVAEVPEHDKPRAPRP